MPERPDTPCTVQLPDDVVLDRANRLGTLLLSAAGLSALWLPVTAFAFSEILAFSLGFALPLVIVFAAFISIYLGILPGAARPARRKAAWATAVAITVLAAWWGIVWWCTRGWAITIYK